MPVQSLTDAKGRDVDVFQLPEPRLASDLADLPFVPADAIVPGLCFRRHVSLLSGQPKAGKSTFVRDVLRRVLAANETSMGLTRSYLRDRFIKGARVLVLSEETGAAWQGFAHDLKHRLPSEALDELGIICRDDPGAAPTDAYEMALWAKAVGATARVHNYDMVLLDPVSRWAALDDENDATQVRRAMAAFQEIARVGNCAVLGIHHTAKNGSTPRGSGAWAAEADVLATFERPPKPEDYPVDECPDSSRLRLLSCVGRLQTIEATTVLWMDDEGDYGATTPAALDGLGFRPRIERDGDELLKALRGRGTGKVSALARFCELTERHALRAAYRLVELNAVTLEERDGEPAVALAFGA